MLKSFCTCENHSLKVCLFQKDLYIYIIIRIDNCKYIYVYTHGSAIWYPQQKPIARFRPTRPLKDRKSVTWIWLFYTEGLYYLNYIQIYVHKLWNKGPYWRTKILMEGQKFTPLKINMEHNHRGLVPILFLSKWVMAVGEPCLQSSRVFHDGSFIRQKAMHSRNVWDMPPFTGFRWRGKG